jgi:kinesin family protein 15
MINLIVRGTKNRHVGSTAMNRESSRSHSVLTCIIESKSMSSNGVWNMKTSRFHIIDLAGSERSKNTNSVGERLKEAGMINKSLSALGNVINSLVDISEGKMRHIPYRDSKLTFILRDSLGGNSKTVIIANISPSQVNLGETQSTLEFARRAKQIKNKAVVNEDSSGTLLILKNEIKRLKKEMNDQNRMYMQLVQDNQIL